jgi:hypothetical protein
VEGKIMARLTVEDLINKKQECKKRKEKKYIEIHSEFLDGEIVFHSLTKDEILEFRDRAREDIHKAALYFIYLSSEDLRDNKLLKAFGRDKFESHKIVEDLFSEAEQEVVMNILAKLNGLTESNPEAIYEKEIEEIKN